MTSKPILVTEPFLPPLGEVLPHLEQIWQSKILTNGGPMHQELERSLCDYLGVRYISLFNNGTIALLTALQALELKGEVITTPYSFVATSHSLIWSQLEPVFVDVDPITLNIDPVKIEAAITPRTTAILAVHCYGHPCDVDAIKKIADSHGLKVIYDAAHAFGVQCQSGSLLNYGDLSVLSLHATKVFNTLEGGAIVSPDAETKKRIDQLKNFGIVNEHTIDAAGINGKMSEINAAVGIVQLNYVDECIAKRQKIDAYYRQQLSTVRGIRCLQDTGEVLANCSYFPILVEEEYGVSRDCLQHKLNEHNIFPRRYFYPLISNLPIYRDRPSAAPADLPIANRAASQILCLPIFPDLELAAVDKICSIIVAR
jgi:dTDP-4-amino-4,6-dideoxygalactose transaminase